MTDAEKEKILSHVGPRECHCCAVAQYAAGEPFRSLEAIGRTKRKRLFIGRCVRCDIGEPDPVAVA
jgi:hypothetical protein